MALERKDLSDDERRLLGPVPGSADWMEYRMLEKLGISWPRLPWSSI